MRKLFYTVIFLAGLLCLTKESQAQLDPNYSQYFSTPLYYNPAYTGINTGIRARFSFRDQWPNLPVDFKSYYFSADLGDRNLPGSGGIGLIVNSNNEGIGFINDLSFGLNISVRVPISAFLVSQIGIKAAVVQKRVKWDEFVFSDQLSERYGNIYLSSFTPPDISKKVFPDFGVGGVLQFANGEGNLNGTVGFAVDHLFKPDESFLSTGTSPLPRKWVANFDMVYTAGGGGNSALNRGGGDPLRLNPGIIYQNQDNLQSLQAGLNLLKYNIYIGAWYKSTLKDVPSSALVLLAGYRYMFADDMSIKFMYSYDLQISGNLQGTGGAHEISLILEFDKLQVFGGGRSSSGSVPGRSMRNNAPLECPSFY